MSDPENSTTDLLPLRSITPMPENNEHNINDIERIERRLYRPAPACMKRKREQKAHNLELLQMCKPLSIKLNRVSQRVISNMMNRSKQMLRIRRRRWQNGNAEKFKKKSKPPETFRKSSEINRTSDSQGMMPSHPWGCCRVIPFEKSKLRSYRRVSTSKNRDLTSPVRSHHENPNGKISEPSTSKMALKDKKISQDNNCSIFKIKENEVSKNILQNSESQTTVSSLTRKEKNSISNEQSTSKLHTTDFFSAREKKSSITREDSSLKSEEDEFVCRRTIPYIRKTCYKSHFISSTYSQNSTSSKVPVQHQEQILKEQKRLEFLRNEKRNSSSGCSKTDPFIFKNKSTDKEKNTKSEISEKLESEVCEKTDETKAPEPNVSRESDNDEDNDDEFSWSSTSMWKLKRKNRSRRISSDSSNSDESFQKKFKSDSIKSNKNNQDLSLSCEKVIFSKNSGSRTLCPPSCTNKEHNSDFFNFLYQKPEIITLKEGRVVLERLENMANDPYVIRWRNNMIKVENEEVEEEEEIESENPRYYVMYEDGTVSTEALPQDVIYQMNELSNFQIEEPSQVYQKVNSYENNSINCPIDMSRYFDNIEDLPHENNILQTHLLNDNDLRDDISRDESFVGDTDSLISSEYPKVLLIRLETLVGSLDSEYSASEIENLEEKYIDFMMNSNFSYDKQSQSFFDVYKRLHAKRAKERKMEIMKDYSDDSSFYMDENNLEIDEIDDTSSRNNEIDEKPLIIALDTERDEINLDDWTSEESSNNDVTEEFNVSEKSIACEKLIEFSNDPDSEVATITSIAEDTREKVSIDNNSDLTSIEFVTCDDYCEKEIPLEPLFITCKFCKVSFRSLHSFTLHKTECHMKNKKPLKCEYCGHLYKCRRNLKLHIQFNHAQGNTINENSKKDTKNTKKSSNSVDKTNSTSDSKKISDISTKVISNNTNAKASSSSTLTKKKTVPAAQQNLCCGVCSVIFETKENLWDHIYKHTERELQDAYRDATKRNKDEELRKKIERMERKIKDREANRNKKKTIESKEFTNKYARWKDRILSKNSSNEETDKTEDTSQNSTMKQLEEIVLGSSESEESEKSNRDCDNIENNSSNSRNSIIKKTNLAQVNDDTQKTVTMCPCHSHDTSTMVNGDMQIEMVLLCETCKVLFRRRDCFEVHYRVNKLCNMDRFNRSPKLFCSSCRIILNYLPEMRNHLEKHAKVNRQGHVTFLCNICKVMFFGVGSLFYSHWFNHNKDFNFIASRYSFPKLSIVPITSINGGPDHKEEYLFVAEYVCKDCKIPFGSEADLNRHKCNMPSASVNINSKEPQDVTVLETSKNSKTSKDRIVSSGPKSSKKRQIEPKQAIVVKMYCSACKKIFVNKDAYDVHESKYTHLTNNKVQYICVATTPEQKAFICTLCKTVRMNMKDLEEHWIYHQPWRKKFVCSRCPSVRSGEFEIIESHCRSCIKNTFALCNVVWGSANFKCLSCNLYFEQTTEWEEHHQICSSATLSLTNTGNTEKEVSSAVEVSVIPSSSNTNNNLTDSLSKLSLKPKSKTAHLLEKYLMLGSNSQNKSTENNGSGSEDVEIIDILSESSSKSSVTELVIETNSLDNEDITTIPVLKTYEKKSTDKVYDSHISGKLRSEYSRKDVSLSKSVVSYSQKMRDNKRKQQISSKTDKSLQQNSISNSSQKTSREDTNKTNAIVTEVIAEEVITLLTEFENQTNLNDISKSSELPRCITNESSKKSNLETTSNTVDTVESSKLNEDPLISGVGSLSTTSEGSSSKSLEKQTLSPLPFEIILLQEEENVASPKPGIVTENSVSQVNLNSNKPVSDQNSASGTVDKINQLIKSKNSVEHNTASIIEEYIEYIMMDVAGSDNSSTQAKNTNSTNQPIKETSSKVEKVAPTRLRVRTLAELQEIRMHLCDICGQSFDTKQNFDEHMEANSCSKSKESFLQPPKNYLQTSQVSKAPGTSTGEDYEATLAQNLVNKGSGSPNIDFIPPLVPLSVSQINTGSRSNIIPVPSNLVIPDPRRRPYSGPSYGNQIYNNGEIIQPSNAGFISVPRSGAIQLPERTGGSGLQKRPSGAATRIQNLSHPINHQTPSVIHHRGLPQTYINRNSGRIGNSSRLPSPYPSSGPIPIQPAPELTNLLIHLMESSTNGDSANHTTNLAVNPESQQIDPAMRNNPNTSGYQNTPITASDIYGVRSSTAGGGSWQTPARYIYACQLCNFRTETKASIRLHEKNHMAMAAMREKSFLRPQGQQLIMDAFRIQTSHQQQQQQKQLQQRQQQQTTQIFSNYPQLMEQQKSIEVTKPNSDTIADKNSVVLYSRISNDIYQCQLCNNFLFSTQDEFMRHLQVAHKQVRKEAVPESVSDNGTICFVCDYCETPQIFETENTLRKHMNFLHNHLCHICAQRCTTREILHNHMLSHKLDNQPK